MFILHIQLPPYLRSMGVMFSKGSSLQEKNAIFRYRNVLTACFQVYPTVGRVTPILAKRFFSNPLSCSPRLFF